MSDEFLVISYDEESKMKKNTQHSALNTQHSYHVPIMLREVMEGLAIKPDGVYVDCTFGGGGHAKELLTYLGKEGRLVAFDQDADAKRNIPEDERVLFVAHNFRYLQRFLRLHKITQVDGILADLGVSSHQFDEAERGFSTRFDGALDMRMDQRQALKAYDVVQTYSEQRLHKLFEQYGEVTNAKTLARTIVNIRKTTSLETIGNFKVTLSGIVKGNPNKYFAQVFQALRIEVNDEMGALKEMLSQVPAVLKPGGRIVVITFHSLEDRMVKNFFKKGSFEEEEEDLAHRLHGSAQKEHSVLKVITKKPLTAGEEELKQNTRARSAKLRIAEKV